MNQEEWRPVPAHSGYEVSNTGRVRSIDRIVRVKGRGKRALKGRVLKQGTMPAGYRYVRGVGGTFLVHRAAALAFLPPRDGAECVDHIDGDKANNCIENLRWATMAENQANRIKGRERASSNYKGVHWVASRGKWRATISHRGKITHIGLFEDELEAARAYRAKSEELNGDFAGHVCREKGLHK